MKRSPNSGCHRPQRPSTGFYNRSAYIERIKSKCLSLDSFYVVLEGVPITSLKLRYAIHYMLFCLDLLYLIYLELIHLFNLYFNKVSQMFICGFWVKKIFIISRSSLYVKSFLSLKEMYMIRVELVLRKKIELNFIFPFFFTVECRWWLLVRIQTLPQIPWIAPEHAVILLHRQ